MTKSEFMKILKEENDLYSAVCKIEDDLNIRCWSKDILEEELFEAVHDGYYKYANKITKALEKYGEDFEYWIWNMENDNFKPLETVDDLEEFFDDEGGGANEI